MAAVTLKNLARMSTATTSTGTITLGSAVSGFLSFANAGVSDGDIVRYAVKDGQASEIGTGTYTASGTTLTRSVIKSTNSNNALNLSGSAEVFITPAAEDFMQLSGWDAGSASLPSIFPAGDTNTGIWFPAADTVALSTSGTERLRVGSTGIVTITTATSLNVGANGATNPAFKVDASASSAATGLAIAAAAAAAGVDLSVLSSGTNENLTINAKGSGTVTINPTGTGAINLARVASILAGSASAPSLYPTGDTNTGLWAPAADTLALSTGGSERVRVDSTGNLLLNATTPQAVGASNTVTPLFQQHGTTNNTAFQQVGRWSADASGPEITLFKSRGAAIGTRGIVSSGDALGALAFRADDGANGPPAASIVGAVDGTPGAGDMPGRLTFNTTADGASAVTERMRIDSSGNVGIGTTTFNYGILELAAAGYTPFAVRSTAGVVGILAANSNSELRLGSVSAHPLDLYTNGTGKVRIESGGNVGIGTTSPLTTTHVAGGTSAYSSGLGTLLVTGGTTAKRLAIGVDTSGTQYAWIQSIESGVALRSLVLQPSGGGLVINEDGADSDVRMEGDTDADLFFLDASTDRIGIGIAAPLGKLHIHKTTFSDLWLSTANTSWRLQAEDAFTGTPGVGLFCNDTSTWTLTVQENGNVKIAGTAVRGTTEGTNHLDIFDGTAPVGTLANGCSIYSTSGELRVMDAAGNATLISPHDAKTNEWIYHSVDTTTGKGLRIDMERLMRKLDEWFGGGFISEFAV